MLAVNETFEVVAKTSGGGGRILCRLLRKPGTLEVEGCRKAGSHCEDIGYGGGQLWRKDSLQENGGFGGLSLKIF